MLAETKRRIIGENSASGFTPWLLVLPQWAENNLSLMTGTALQFFAGMGSEAFEDLTSRADLLIYQASAPKSEANHFYRAVHEPDVHALEDEFLPRLPLTTKPITLRLRVSGKGKPTLIGVAEETFEE